MFETFVSSRIRRALFEHILSHPAGRFYLRGLAKELSLAVSPVRRELLRLEQLGVLKAYDEANVRFYVVDQTSPQFTQLKQAAASLTVPASTVPASERNASLVPASAVPASERNASLVAGSVEPVVASTVLSHRNVERVRKALAPRFSLPILVSALSFGLLIVGVFGLSMYWAVTPKVQVTEREAEPPAASGEMRGARWRVVPGGMGGFSSGATREGSH